MESTQLTICGVERVAGRAVWYKVTTRDASGKQLFYPTSAVMSAFIAGDVKKHGAFVASVELESRAQFKSAHFSMSKLLRSYDFICPAESQIPVPESSLDTESRLCPGESHTD